MTALPSEVRHGRADPPVGIEEEVRRAVESEETVWMVVSRDKTAPQML
jgi:hypothetical protein